MAKLTQTELKVLANEIQNRISTIIKQREQEIKNKKEYIAFEDTFDKSEVGHRFNNMIHEALALEEVMTRNEYYNKQNLPHSYTYSSSNDLISKRLINVKENYVKFLKEKQFPIPKIELGNIQKSSWSNYVMTPYEYALHQLNLRQLKDESDIGAILDELVTELSSKIN